VSAVTILPLLLIFAVFVLTILWVRFRVGGKKAPPVYGPDGYQYPPGFPYPPPQGPYPPPPGPPPGPQGYGPPPGQEPPPWQNGYGPR
jgi:hypothetical protein